MRDELDDVVGRVRDVEDEERLTRDLVDEERLTLERVRCSLLVVERRCFVRKSLRELVELEE